MGLFNKPAPEDAPAPAVVAAAPVVDDLAGQPYTGDPKAVIFREGFYYVVDFDPDGNELGPNNDKKLVWRDGGLHHARPEDPNHFHTYGLNPVEISPAHEGGQ